jgi:YgiT-type zinc finger domain-containing protein
MPEESGTTHECPLCGGTMRLKTTETVVLVPGNPTGTTRKVSEWVCPDCDYYEEVDLEG